MSIKVGDLVMVVKTMPCGHGKTGAIFEVEAIVDPNATSENWCAYCGRRSGDYSPMAKGGGTKHAACFTRLRRIPPLDEMEGRRSWEELNTPVLL